MTSSVFFRFKSQKEPTRVAFDGTGISVFELKREIILSNRLGDGTDFELVISSEDTGEDGVEYDDDTHLIPRSTAVIAKRLPAFKPGRGGAARYVSGKMPQNAKNSHRTDTAAGNPATSKRAETSNGLSDMNGARTEEEKIAAMFKLGADQWAQQQQEMANAIPVHRSGPSKGKQANVPDRPPPPGYVCYRCGEKGHWIQACPTNDDPAYVNRPRVKRTTGIPRSFLKTVEKPTAIANDGTVDETKQPAGVMVNADGEWVVAEPDKASWDQYQARAKVSAAAQEEAVRGNKALQEKGLECPIDKRLFTEPMQTPCCQKTYCLECITNTLLDNDLKCPHCATENVPVDDLTPDEQMTSRIQEYKQEQEEQMRWSLEATKSPGGDCQDGKNTLEQETADVVEAVTKSTSGTSKQSTQAPQISTTDSPGPENTAPENSKEGMSKKRPAESPLTNTHTPPRPSIEAKQHGDPKASANSTTPSISLSTATSGMAQTMGSIARPVAANFMNMSMGMMPPLPMGMGPYSSMGLVNPFMGGSGANWNAIWNGTFPQQPMGTTGGGFPNGMTNNQFSAHNVQLPMHNGYAGPNGMGANGIVRGSFPNQQRNHFAGFKANEEDSAYFRKPVNPHRHQARRNVNRPADYREI
ncbi:MAG: hypothetical protein Q9166_004744 [cf. Caloplaca sp. 2 TL-2023]